MYERKLTGYPSVDQPWTKFDDLSYFKGFRNKPLPTHTLYEWLCNCNKERLDNTALQYFGGKISYRKLFWHIEQTACSLLALGACQGDVIALCMPNTPEGIYAFYAINAIGAVCCLIDPRTAPVGIQNFVNETSAKILMVIDLCIPKIAEISSQTKLKHIVVAPATQSLSPIKRIFAPAPRFDRDAMPNGSVMWTDFIKTGNTQKFQKGVYTPDTLAVIAHTGGTTGIPKGVELTSDAYNMLSFITQQTTFMKNGATSLDIMPLFSAYGSAFGAHTPLCEGKQLILIPQLQPEDFPNLIMKYKPNHAIGVPSFWEYLAESPRAQKKDLSFLKTAIVGGDMLNSETEKKVNQFLYDHGSTAKLTKGYGLTEVASAFTYTLSNESNATGSVGIPLYKNNCKIVAPGTCTELGYGMLGEICLAGPTLMKGYYKNPKATQDVMKTHQDGIVWLHTGDIGKIDKDGLLYVVGRIKRIIIGPNGHNVFPSLSENIIAQHPAVKVCAVVGKKNPSIKNGVIPTAYIVLKKGSGDTAEISKTLDKLCKKALPDCDCPYEYRFVDAIPYTVVGKVDYRILEEME